MKSKKKGNRGEEIAIKVLKRIGVLMPEEIGTPFSIVAVLGKGVYRGFFKSKVSGDIRGHRSDGVAVLAEVKTVPKLSWSTLTKHGEHQAARLDQHAQHAISLVVWVRSADEVFILEWPIQGFEPRKSISPEQAAKLNMTDIDISRNHINLVNCDCEYCQERNYRDNLPESP